MLKKFNLWGLRDSDTGEVVVPTEFDKIGDFVNGAAIVSKKIKVETEENKFEERYGFIFEDGKSIPVKYTDANYFYKNGYAFVKKNGKRGIVFRNGKEVFFEKDFCITETGIEDVFILMEKIGGYEKAYVKIDSKKSECKLITDFKYEMAGPFNFGRAIVRWNKYFGFIDKNGKEIIPTKYTEVENISEYLIHTKFYSQSNIVDLNGNILFKDVSSVQEYSSLDKVKFLVFFNYEKCCLINEKGEIFGRKYKSIGNFKYGMAKVQEGNKVSIVNEDFVEIITFRLKKEDSIGIKFGPGFAIVSKNDKEMLINKNGETLFKAKNGELIEFDNHLGIVIVTKKDKKMLINEKGETLDIIK